ncbi:TetR/AcrR family transcriptional regulator [Mycolicibacter longobardus]|uniref:TetR/AcrR family transcriptional regulator n=1 Tax=Mycolicibacter longobardus TaxID=1108812 RepID=UPI0021F26C1B|nr:TetR/AcrR family transcriptional regulator [Mycolicibacter longobardus]MCV7384783.1 TetR/AcrR family transcriptional regulator [Mycolicibacter longobardus]
MIDPQFVSVIGQAFTGSAGSPAEHATDPTAQRILDAAVQEAATVGLRRITIEDVVRRAGVSRMTAYRRYPRREDLIQALIRRETQRFLATVADAIENTPDPHHGVAEAFVAAITFAREHPMLSRAGQFGPLPAADSKDLLAMGSAFIANYIHGDAPGSPSRSVRWVADVFARLFFTYISMPSTDPDFRDDAALRLFAQDVLTPMAERAVG